MARILFLILLLLFCTGLATGQNAEQSILSYQRYGATEHQNPYILEFKNVSGMFLFYGAEHTVDPQNPEIGSAAFH